MGMYTLFHASFTLRADAPVEVKDALIKLADGQSSNIDHAFFKCERHTGLFLGASAYFDEPNFCMVSNGHEYDEPEAIRVRVQAQIKNYDHEIQKFADWIKPHIDAKSGPVIYSRYEESSYNQRYV